MTLFWHGHFATSYRGVQNSYHLHMQNRLFRAHAIGGFDALLRGIIRDPAMLDYLDNRNSRKGAPNENLARELMELFSLGPGHYREGDIKEGARALTGYTFQGNRFVFDAQRHDRGGKTILGRTGHLNGDGFVEAILDRTACARFIAGKLHRWLVADPIPGESEHLVHERDRAIDSCAEMLKRDRYAMGPMLRAVLRSRHFYDAGNSKIRGPVELVVQTVRTLGTPTRRPQALARQLDAMGQSLFMPPNVAGWPGGRSWINTSTLFMRQNAAAYLITGELPEDGRHGRAHDLRPLLETMIRLEIPGNSHGQRLASLLLGDPSHPAAAEADGLMGAKPDAAAAAKAAVLLTACPEYQLC